MQGGYYKKLLPGMIYAIEVDNIHLILSEINTIQDNIHFFSKILYRYFSSSPVDNSNCFDLIVTVYIYKNIFDSRSDEG